MMINWLQGFVFIFVAVSATGVVLTRDPPSQAVAISFYGILLGVLFFLFEAPDVALSQITIGAVVLPMMILLALARVRRDSEARAEKKQTEKRANSRARRAS